MKLSVTVMPMLMFWMLWPSLLMRRNSSMSGCSMGMYAAKDPLRALPWLMTSLTLSNISMKWTAPLLSPPTLILVPRALKAPKYPLVPPPILLMIPTSAALVRIASILSST